MTDIRIDVDYGPPIIPHGICGRRNADLPVGGINVLVHRYFRRTDWRMFEAIKKQWVLSWPTRGRGRIVHLDDAHNLSSGSAYLMPPHTTFSGDCTPGSSGGVTLHDLAEATSLTERSLPELVLRTTGDTPITPSSRLPASAGLATATTSRGTSRSTGPQPPPPSAKTHGRKTGQKDSGGFPTGYNRWP